jgi:hypothetical protein
VPKLSDLGVTKTRWQALVALPLQQREAGCLPGKTPIGGRGLPGDAERARQLENFKALSSSRLPLDQVRPVRPSNAVRSERSRLGIRTIVVRYEREHRAPIRQYGCRSRPSWKEAF